MRRSTRSQEARRTAWPHRERGSTTLEIAVIFPAVLAIMFLVIEGALWYQARNIALAAAEEGVRVATGDGSSYNAGVNRANAFAHQAGANDMLSNITVTGASGTEIVTITVEGTSLSLFGDTSWVAPRVSQSASAPVERFTTD